MADGPRSVRAVGISTGIVPPAPDASAPAPRPLTSPGPLMVPFPPLGPCRVLGCTPGRPADPRARCGSSVAHFLGSAVYIHAQKKPKDFDTLRHYAAFLLYSSSCNVWFSFLILLDHGNKK